MTTATAPARSRTEILSTEVRDGERHHRVRWHYGDAAEPLDAWASEPIEPVSREILEDRWRGIMGAGRREATEAQTRLDALLHDMAEELTRRDVQERAVVDGQVTGLDVVMDIDGLEHVIRDWMIDRAAKVAGR